MFPLAETLHTAKPCFISRQRYFIDLSSRINLLPPRVCLQNALLEGFALFAARRTVVKSEDGGRLSRGAVLDGSLLTRADRVLELLLCLPCRRPHHRRLDLLAVHGVIGVLHGQTDLRGRHAAEGRVAKLPAQVKLREDLL